jgi:hypothetical protein
MENWWKCNRLLFILSILLFSFYLKPWGFLGHKTINRMAVFTLPKEMLGFYKSNIEFITSESVKPDSRRYTNKKEGAGHYMDLEFYDTSIVQHKNWTEITKIYSEDSLYRHGILPWRIIQYKYLLQKAFETKDLKKILVYSSELGHYIADAHVPLHTTRNYNGQFTNQHGIHSLWETRVVELILNEISYFTDKSTYIDNLPKYIWKIIKQSHSEIPIVLNTEKQLFNEGNISKFTFKLNQNDSKNISPEYLKEYNLRMNGLVEKKIKAAILAIGSVWYTAWIDAGQPELMIKSIHFKEKVSNKEIGCDH